MNAVLALPSDGHDFIMIVDGVDNGFVRHCFIRIGIAAVAPNQVLHDTSVICHFIHLSIASESGS